MIVPADPCLDNDCDGNATCSSMESEVICTCNPGFIGDGRECVGRCLHVKESFKLRGEAEDV